MKNTCKSLMKACSKVTAVMCAMVICITTLTGCSNTSTNQEKKTTDKLQVVVTIFPYYDFVREIAGDTVDVSMVVPAGMDTHSFEPTAKDMVTIGTADLFIYNGGEMETWVSQVVDAAENKSLIADSMMEHVDTVVEETVEGMEAENDNDHAHEADSAEIGSETDVHADDNKEEKEYDEHIWTSPVNAQKIVEQIADDLCQADPENKDTFQKNAKAYIGKLKKLDQQFQQVVDSTKNNYLVFGDRFPLRYFVDQYDLKYTAAFAGCSSDTEPSADTVAYLTDQMKAHDLPVVLKIELTSDKVAKSIAEATGARVETFYTCHNVTKQQLEQGESYIHLMEQNVKTLAEALQTTVK